MLLSSGEEQHRTPSKSQMREFVTLRAKMGSLLRARESPTPFLPTSTPCEYDDFVRGDLHPPSAYVLLLQRMTQKHTAIAAHRV